MATQSRGTCVFCRKMYSKGGMTRHLQSCKIRQEIIAKQRGDPARVFHLVAEGVYAPEYWLHLEASADLLLEELDSFLRDTWLECCGHLSAFRIEGQTYTQLFDDDFFSDDKDMKVRLDRIFYPGLEMDYEYDFGSTTYLKLRVAGERGGPPLSQRIEIMARNEPPVYPCSVCGQPAVEICTMCVYNDQGLLCLAHAETHPCGDEFFLPVVNSPRIGVCGYVGDAYDYMMS